MKIELEKYLEKKRPLLDTETPDNEAIWAGIKGGMTRSSRTVKPSRNIRMRIITIAASVLILFSLGYLTKDIVDTIGRNKTVTLSDISTALGQKENSYRLQVSLKRQEVNSLTGTDNMVIKELFEEINRLDVVYDQSLKDLKELGYNEKIVNTIFDTYEKKIHLLELIILESNKSVSHENNGKINL